MKQVQAAEFRIGFSGMTEPVEVVKYKTVIGTWYPGEAPTLGTVQVDVAEMEPVKMKMAEAQKIIDMQEDEIRQLKRIVAANAKPGPKFALSGDPTFTTEFRPVPKPGKAK
jgi:hypothetical protein